MNKVYGYCRTARAEGGNMEEQIKLVSKYCKDKGLNLVTCYCDNGVSAHNVDRIGMSKLFDIIRKGDMIVTRDYSRFTRNPTTLQIFIDNMNSMDVEIMCIEENEDDSAPFDYGRFKYKYSSRPQKASNCL